MQSKKKKKDLIWIEFETFQGSELYFFFNVCYVVIVTTPLTVPHILYYNDWSP